MVQARYRYINGKRVKVNPDGTVPTQNAQASGKAPPTGLNSGSGGPRSPDKEGQGQGAPKPRPVGDLFGGNIRMALAEEKMAQAALERGDSKAALMHKRRALELKRKTVGMAKGGTVKKEKKAKKAPDSLTKPPRTMAKGEGRSFGRPPFKFNGPSR